MAGDILEEAVVNCSEEECFHFEIPYSESDLHQMRSLVDRSLECSQEIIIECLGAPLKVSLLQLTLITSIIVIFRVLTIKWLGIKSADPKIKCLSICLLGLIVEGVPKICH